MFSVILWYPIPFMRKFPLHSSLILGIMTRKWRIFSLIHVVFTFFLFPLMILGINDLMTSRNLALISVGVIILVILGITIFPLLLFWFFGAGKEIFVTFLKKHVFEETGNYKPNSPDDDISFRDRSSANTSIGGGSSTGGYEVKYNNKHNSKQKRKVNNSLNNMKSKLPKRSSRQRLKKTTPPQTESCNGEEACGIGVFNGI